MSCSGVSQFIARTTLTTPAEHRAAAYKVMRNAAVRT
jgi:hypothetical protein